MQTMDKQILKECQTTVEDFHKEHPIEEIATLMNLEKEFYETRCEEHCAEGKDCKIQDFKDCQYCIDFVKEKQNEQKSK